MTFTEYGDVLEGTKTVRFYPCAGSVSFSLTVALDRKDGITSGALFLR